MDKLKRLCALKKELDSADGLLDAIASKDRMWCAVEVTHRHTMAANDSRRWVLDAEGVLAIVHYYIENRDRIIAEVKEILPDYETEVAE